MATVTQSARVHAPARAVQQGYPEGSLRFDWIMTGLSVLFMAGLWVDGWAHFHGEVDDSFFTPWHFLFYSAFGIVALFLAFNHWRNVGKGYHSRRALPQGYWFSLVGAMTFALGGVGDMIWHTLFGIEEGSEALTSPTHLALALGMALVFSGALRSAWVRTQSGEQRGWRALGPAIIAMTLLFTLVAFFTSYAHPVVTPFAAGFIEERESPPQLSQLYIMNPDGSAQTRLTNSPDLNAGSIAWSPDGSQFVYSLGEPGDNGSGQSDLYIANADGSNSMQLTSAPGEEYSPAWSPDSKQIAYVGRVEGNPEIFVLPAEGGEATRLTTSQGEEWGLDWSPDGTQIAYTMGSNDTNDIYVMNADGSGIKALTSDGTSWQPAWSPDGKIIFSMRQNGNGDIYLMNADGSKLTRLTDHHSFDTGATFSADGEQILFTSWRDGTPALYTMPASGEVGTETKAVNISQNPALRIWEAEMSPDGSTILFAASGQESSSNGPNTTQDLGVISFLFQAALMSGVILLLLARWSLPFGAITLLLTVNAILLTLLNDFFVLIPGALITGLIADVLIRRWKLSPENLSRATGLAFLVPLIYAASYFLTIQLIVGISWSIHVWAGAIVLSGLTGWLVSSLLTQSRRLATT